MAWGWNSACAGGRGSSLDHGPEAPQLQGRAQVWLPLVQAFVVRRHCVCYVFALPVYTDPRPKQTPAQRLNWSEAFSRA
jgi:hypothetical protein